MRFDPDDLAQLAELVRGIVREELATAPGREEYMTVAAAARVAAVTAGTIRDWVKVGKLGRYNAGAQLRVRRSELDALMRAPPPCEPEPGADLEEIGRRIARRQAGVR